MNYSIEYLPANQLKSIEVEWKQLESGEDMTIFQSYEWNQLLLEKYVPADTKNYVSIYAIIRKSNEICLIAPLWITKRRFNLVNKKGAFLLGVDSYSDYLNVLYRVFDPVAFDYLISNVQKKYRIKYFYFSHINEKTATYEHITKHYILYKDEKEPCVGIQIPLSIDEYLKLLSKHSRQNLRTANNRINKDGKSIIFDMDDTHIDKDDCLRIRESKLNKEYKKMSQYNVYKYRLKNRFQFIFPRFSPLKCYVRSKIMTAKIDNNLCAFFHYVYDDYHNKIVIISAGTDLTYARYSPGMLLLYNFVKDVVEGGSYKEVDLTRGDEPYKFALGGYLSFNHELKFCCK